MTGLQILILYRTGLEPQFLIFLQNRFRTAVLNFNRTAVPSLIGPQVLIRTELNFKNWFEPANMELFNIPSKTTVDCIEHVVDVVKRSSIAGLNKAWRYNDRNGFQYFDIINGLKTYFKKLPGLRKFQHFIFTNANPGIIKAQEIANGTFQKFKLLKINKFTANKILEKVYLLL